MRISSWKRLRSAHTVGQPFNCHDGMSDRQIEAFNRRIEAEWRAATPSAQGGEGGG